MQDQYLEYLTRFLRIPSISTQDEHLEDMSQARTFLKDVFEEMGFDVQMLPAKRHSAVFASKIINPENPTVLIYGHYDVQPADPLEQWHTSPFEPVIQNNFIYARGATDNKGQIMLNIMAVKTFLEENKTLNFKFIVEGEEEIGSISVADLAQKYSKDLFACDYLIVSDSEMPHLGQPAIDISLRGLVYTEIVVTAAQQDLHSGQFGGVAENPANALAHVIAKLKDDKNHVHIPNFYDDVVTLTAEEKDDYQKAEISEKELADEGKLLGVGGGEEKYSLNERRWSQPTLDVNGIVSGYTGEGSKTIIPAKASAKISMRLVPNQDPEKIYKDFCDFVKSITSQNVQIEIINHSNALPYKSPTDHPVFETMKKALKKSFGKNAIFQGVGGSIGFVPVLANAIHVPVLMVGFGLPTDNTHSPNEHFSLENYFKGIKAMLEFYKHVRI